jgi:hypothetical protein
LDGIQALSKHRLNYGVEGPQKLTVLWWEWPSEHWAELRDGASMNFMEPPPPSLIPNTVMTEDELATAGRFVDELIRLEVVGPHDAAILNNCPIFVVPKPGQPGQWRCIADGK